MRDRLTAVRLAGCLFASVLLAGTASGAELWLANARVIDGTGAAPSAARSVHIRDGKLVAISEHAAPAGAIDLHGSYLLRIRISRTQPPPRGRCYPESPPHGCWVMPT